MRRRNYRRQNNNRPEHRINDYIRIPEVRLVGDNLKEIGNELGIEIESGIYDTRTVKQWAYDVELDLVEISPKAKPPVVKIIDYKKFLYLQKKKKKEIQSKTAKTVIKELRFGPNTDDHDFEFKKKHAIKFLESGAKVKAYVHFRGRTIVFKDRGRDVLHRFIEELEDYGSPEGTPRMEGRRMHVMLAPNKEILKKK